MIFSKRDEFQLRKVAMHTMIDGELNEGNFEKAERIRVRSFSMFTDSQLLVIHEETIRLLRARNEELRVQIQKFEGYLKEHGMVIAIECLKKFRRAMEKPPAG